jgi:3-phosphoshikimate 1-carboxyvinyltransferase
MIEALRGLGAAITVHPASPNQPATPACTLAPSNQPLAPSNQPVVTVQPGPLRGNLRIDCGLAGTVMRFLLPVAALANAPVTFDGDPAARERPLAPLLTALRQLGISLDDQGRGTLPVTIHGKGCVTGYLVDIDTSASSQFLSALLLAAPRFANGLTVTNIGNSLPSAPHVDMTLTCLRQFGATAVGPTSQFGATAVGPTSQFGATAVGPTSQLANPGHSPARPTWQVSGSLTGQTVQVEPDLSNAGPFIAAALVTAGQVRVLNWPQQTTQPGDILRQYVRQFGGQVQRQGNDLLFTATPGSLVGADLDLTPAGELAPTLAAIALFATSPTRLRGIAHLRGHETDRLAALEQEITRLGGHAHQTADGLVISPTSQLHGADLETYNDHRMATFAAIVGLRLPGVRVRNIATTAKTLPDFPTRWLSLLPPNQPSTNPEHQHEPC